MNDMAPFEIIAYALAIVAALCIVLLGVYFEPSARRTRQIIKEQKNDDR
jgi:hypothetical protein